MSTTLPGPRGATQVRLLRRLFADPAPVLDELHAAYGPACQLGGGPVRMAIVGDPALLRTVWSMSNDTFRWGHPYNVLGFIVGRQSLLVSDGADHRRRRGAVQGGFTRKRLNGWVPMIVERADATIDRIVASAPTSAASVDLYPFGRRLVLEIAVRALFGERLSARVDELDALFERPQRYLESPALRQVPHPFPRTERARVRADREAIGRIIEGEIAHHRRHPIDDADNVLAGLVRDGGLTDTEMRDQVVTLIGAGYHTTAASLAWILRRASAAPGLWDDLRAEAHTVLGDARADALDHTHLAGLALASGVMHETLRLHPAGLISPRQVATDIELGPYVLTKGTMLLWSAYLAGREPSAWADPMRFDPPQFGAPSAEQKAVIDTGWLPFGKGPRQCIGFALAQMELTLITARLAQRLEITPVDPAVPRPHGMVVNRPAGGAPMRVVARGTELVNRG